ncbi:MAG: hypothetical protein NT051_01480 [Candidatus Micrarchaeota archaeon]|nr:hypothetical protein [Candidatus Micrarchaeota archaeon]
MAAALKEIRGKSKLHAELVCADASKLFEWAILQISSAGWLNAARPYSRPLDGYHIADAVMGFADAKVSGVHHAGAIPKQEDSSYNKAHKNYLLTVEVKDLVAFNRNWRISDYSNAGAIALIARESGNLVFSHFGGALRMLGMPVFVFDHGTGAARAVLSLDLDAKCNVYADEMAAFKEQRGGIGPIAESTKKQFSFWPFNKL